VTLLEERRERAKESKWISMRWKQVIDSNCLQCSIIAISYSKNILVTKLSLFFIVLVILLRTLYCCYACIVLVSSSTIDVAHKSVWCLCLSSNALTSVKRLWVMCCAVSSVLVCALSCWVCDTPRRIWPMWVVASVHKKVTSPKYMCIWAVRDVEVLVEMEVSRLFSLLLRFCLRSSRFSCLKMSGGNRNNDLFDLGNTYLMKWLHGQFSPVKVGQYYIKWAAYHYDTIANIRLILKYWNWNACCYSEPFQSPKPSQFSCISYLQYNWYIPLQFRAENKICSDNNTLPLKISGIPLKKDSNRLFSYK
jgi:hypothetical protein